MKPNTPEQDQLRADLIARFGLMTYTRAWEMSCLRNCMQALALDEMSAEERAAAYTMAGMHLARLQTTFITAEQSTALTDCAKRIDVAIETWAVDAIEERDGLPPRL